MMSDCQDCDRVQETQLEGNASIRPPFHQPTMYDHLCSFSKFKEEKANAMKIKSKEEELLKFNKKFTNLEMTDKSGDTLETFSTQDIARFRCNLKEGRFHQKRDKTEPVDLWKSIQDLKPVVSLTTISRSPITCPVSKCGKTIGVTSLLSHFHRDHNEDLLVDCTNLYADGRSILLFEWDILDFGENVCLGILSYGGVEDKSSSRPAVRGICKQNSFLSKTYSHLENHLPILVMVCKTSMCAMLEDKELAKKLIDPKDKLNHVLIIWLASVPTTKPIFCTITAFDRSMISSRSTIINVRSLDSSQHPEEFISSENNYLMLNYGELNILSEKCTESIRMEIRIQEFDD